MKQLSTPVNLEVHVETINDQIGAIEDAQRLIVEANEMLHSQIAEAQRAIRKNTRELAKNEMALQKLRQKRSIFTQAARAIIEVDQP